MTPDAKDLEAAIVLMNDKLGERIEAAEAVLLTIIYSDVDDKNDALDAMACAYFRKYPQARRR